MTAKELSESIGRRVIARIKVGTSEYVNIQAVIVDARQCWSRIDYKLDYTGQQFWLASDHVTIE